MTLVLNAIARAWRAKVRLRAGEGSFMKQRQSNLNTTAFCRENPKCESAKSQNPQRLAATRAADISMTEDCRLH